jgi:hypothetical protein
MVLVALMQENTSNSFHIGVFVFDFDEVRMDLTPIETCVYGSDPVIISDFFTWALKTFKVRSNNPSAMQPLDSEADTSKQPESDTIMEMV